MHCRRGRAQVGEGLGLGCGEGGGFEGAEPLEHLGRAGEGALHRELLIEKHAREERERIVGEHLVSGLVLGDTDLGCHAAHLAACRSPSPEHFDEGPGAFYAPSRIAGRATGRP